jgi:hypothetical protein
VARYSTVVGHFVFYFALIAAVLGLSYGCSQLGGEENPEDTRIECQQTFDPQHGC